MHDSISIIITIRLTPTLFEAERRLHDLCSVIPRNFFEIVIVDYGTPETLRGPLLAYTAQPGIQVVRHPEPNKIFSIGAARDYGAQVANCPALLFMDIDFHAPQVGFQAIYKLASKMNLFKLTDKFLCIPVFFLTEQGTLKYERGIGLGIEWLVPCNIDQIEDDKENIAFPSYGSSAILINRMHYMSVGGHHPSFQGHGAEDFELLHRLSSLTPWGERPVNYYFDTKIKNMEPLSGFRPYFARYALPALRQGLFFIHRYHPPRQEADYFFRKRQNFSQLIRLMKKYDNCGVHPSPLSDLKSRSQVRPGHC